MPCFIYEEKKFSWKMNKQPNPRGRISKACDECAKSKCKCDGQSPCDACVSSTRICTYSMPSKKRGPSTGFVSNLSDTIDSLKQKLEQEGDLSSSDQMSSSIVSLNQAVSWDSLKWEQGNAVVWTHKSFQMATLYSQGKAVPWWDVYYAYVHPKWPFIFKSWFMNHFSSIPLILLHAMFSTCTFYLQGPNGLSDVGEFHFAACKNVIDEAIENPDPLKTAAIFLIAVYSLNSKRIKSSVSYLCLSIRFSQILGLDKDRYDVWKNSKGLIAGFENDSPKDFTRSLWTCLYAHDFFAIFLIGVPGSVTLDIDLSYLDEYKACSFDRGVEDASR